MELRTLRYFVYIAEARSFSNASVHLRVAQHVLPARQDDLPGIPVPEQGIEFPASAAIRMGGTGKGLWIDLKVTAEIGALPVGYRICDRLPALLRCHAVEKHAHPAHMQLCPAVRAFLVAWQRQQQILQRITAFPAGIGLGHRRLQRRPAKTGK